MGKGHTKKVSRIKAGEGVSPVGILEYGIQEEERPVQRSWGASSGESQGGQRDYMKRGGEGREVT